MTTPDRAGRYRSVLFALFLSLIGFSYAVATSPRSTPESGPAAADRMVGSSLNFANVKLANGNRDLGDAVVGSACFVRTIGVLNGIAPYSFSISSNANALAANNLGLVSMPLVGLFGTAGNGIIPLTASAGPLTFGVSAQDSLGSNATAAFTLNILSGQNQFRFALAQLNDGVQYRDYECALPVINGTPPYTFSEVAGSVIAGGKSQTNLKAVGLSLSSDGMLIGQPTVSGTISFTAACSDARKLAARSRDGTTTNQLMTLNIQGNVVVSNTVVVTSFSAKGDTATGGKDKATLTAQLNLNGHPVSSLSGPIVFRLGAAVITTGAGTKGKFELLKKGGVAKAPSVKAAVTASGQLKATFSNQSFGTRGSFGPFNASNIFPIQITVGNVIDGLSVINAGAKPQKNTKYAMNYTLGTIPKGGVSGTVAGAFILTGVTGKDDTKGVVRDAWKVSFIAVPPSGRSFNSAGTSATVSIGTNFSDKQTISAAKGVVKTGKIAAKSVDKFTRLSMSDKGKGSYQTGPLDSTLTGIRPASKSTAQINYGTEIDLGKFYGGAGSLAIFPKKSQWSSKNPVK
jgi:hypothetical protein